MGLSWRYSAADAQAHQMEPCADNTRKVSGRGRGATESRVVAESEKWERMWKLKTFDRIAGRTGNPAWRWHDGGIGPGLLADVVDRR